MPRRPVRDFARWLRWPGAAGLIIEVEPRCLRPRPRPLSRRALRGRQWGGGVRVQPPRLQLLEQAGSPVRRGEKEERDRIWGAGRKTKEAPERNPATQSSGRG